MIRRRWHGIAFFHQKEISAWGVSIEYRRAKLAEYVRGWMGYFGVSEYDTVLPTLDKWLRRRVQLCYWKRWRHARTRSRELMRLGVPRRQVIRHGKSRKGCWHMARTIASGVGLTNAWLQAQGLVSLKSLWAELAPLR